MRAVIQPGSFSGVLAAPPSKSYTQRAYAAALLHGGTTTIIGAGQSADEQAALGIIQQLGASVETYGPGMRVTSTGNVSPTTHELFCGESGLSARLFAPIAACAGMPISITGTGTLLTRSMRAVADVLPLLGVQLPDFKGYVPFSLQGPLVPAPVTIDGSGGSQLLSGLLFALGSCVTEPLHIQVKRLTSRPYIDMSIEVLNQIGIEIDNDRYRTLTIHPRAQVAQDIKIAVEADWSSAAFPLVAGAIAGSVTVTNLNASSCQADRAILQVLADAGAQVNEDGANITVCRSRLVGFTYDATHSPDLFPALAILAACCEGESQVRGVHRLFDKESNRVESVTEMLFDFGVPFSVEDDTLFVTGADTLRGTVIDSYRDHRIAMAAAVGALRAKAQVDVLNAEVVSKSYPGFFAHMQLCGLQCNFIES